MRDKKAGDLAYIEYALETIEKINSATLELTKKGLVNDDLYIDLMAFYIAQIGEQFAPDKVSEELKEKYFTKREVQEIYGTSNHRKI